MMEGCSNMEQFIGCDAHKKFTVFVAINEKGQAGEALRVMHDRQLYRESGSKECFLSYVLCLEPIAEENARETPDRTLITPDELAICIPDFQSLPSERVPRRSSFAEQTLQGRGEHNPAWPMQMVPTKLAQNARLGHLAWRIFPDAVAFRKTDTIDKFPSRHWVWRNGCYRQGAGVVISCRFCKLPHLRSCRTWSLLEL